MKEKKCKPHSNDLSREKKLEALLHVNYSVQVLLHVNYSVHMTAQTIESSG